MYSLILAAHVGAGAIALFTYWVAGLARKGSPVHRRAGRWFMGAMVLIAATALPLGVAQIQQGRPLFGLFLLYLLVLTSAGLYTAWYSVQRKRDPGAYFGAGYRRWATALLTAAAGIFIVGIAFDSGLLWGFSLVGLIRGAHMHWLARRPVRPRWWFGEHMGSMIGNGIATHVAFLNIGLRRLLPDLPAELSLVLAFYLPLGVAALAAIWLNWRYRPRPVLPVGAAAQTPR